MSPSEYRSSIKEVIKFAEGVLRLKAVLDAADDIDAKTAAREKAHAAAVAAHEQEIAQYISKVKAAQDLYTKAQTELDSHQAAYEAAHQSLDDAMADAKDKHAKALASMQSQAQSTLASLTQDKAAVMKSLQEAKVLHAAEMQAMHAEKAKMEHDLVKLRDVRAALLAQLQTGV